MNRKTIKTECLVPEDTRECRVHQQLTLMKCAHVSSIVTEANHSGVVCLLKSGFERQQLFKDRFSSYFDGLSQKNHTFIKNNVQWLMGHLSKTRFS